MQVIFSKHAAERMQQRLSMPVASQQQVILDSAFKHNLTYLHHNNTLVQSWYCIIPGVRCVLIVSNDSRVVLTVMTEGPVVDAIYRNAMH